MDHHHFAVDDRFAWNSERAGNFRKALGPVQPVAGKDLFPASVEMDLNAVTVVLDLVDPLLALRRFGLQGGELGFNEPRHLNTLWHSETHNAHRTQGPTAGSLPAF
jgi:hypothetical protein